MAEWHDGTADGLRELAQWHTRRAAELRAESKMQQRIHELNSPLLAPRAPHPWRGPGTAVGPPPPPPPPVEEEEEGEEEDEQAEEEEEDSSSPQASMPKAVPQIDAKKILLVAKAMPKDKGSARSWKATAQILTGYWKECRNPMCNLRQHTSKSFRNHCCQKCMEASPAMAKSGKSSRNGQGHGEHSKHCENLKRQKSDVKGKSKKSKGMGKGS